ncbi:MAG TPA: hypothetical protein VG826_26860 [Pirellulales bacterium]|nr:hypothetical protein [Pirellulales bacterium]
MIWHRTLVAAVVAALLVGSAWSAVAPGDVEPEVDKAKAKLAADIYAQRMVRVINNEDQIDVEDLALWSQHILDAEIDLASGDAQRLGAYEAQLKRSTELARIAKSFAESGQGLASDAMAAEFYRLEALSQLAKAKAR